MPTLLCHSLRRAYAECRDDLTIMQLSDQETPEVEGVDMKIVAIDSMDEKICLRRYQAYRLALKSLGGPIVFVDTDMLFLRPLSSGLGEASPALCRRSFGGHSIVRERVRTPFGKIEFHGHRGKTFDNLFPFLACYLSLPDVNYMDRILEKYERLSAEYKIWYGDQVVLKEFAEDFQCELVLESTHACLPEHFLDQNREDVYALHYKGPRKSMMAIDFWNLLSSKG